MDAQAYLDRIGYHGHTHADFETLRALQRAHLYSVPFENLDIGRGIPLRLDEHGLFDKIVRRRRGGFCYELNGLFSRLLEHIGFHVVLLSAAGANDDGSEGAEFDHLCLQVHGGQGKDLLDGDGPWLVDVGWGNGPLEPLRLLDLSPQHRGERLFKITPEGCRLVLIERATAEGQEDRWVRHYSFSLVPRRREDFDGMFQYHQTSAESIFVRKRICSRFLPDGHITLSEGRLITTRGGKREERTLESEAEAQQVLREQFGVVLPPKGDVQG